MAFYRQKHTDGPFVALIAVAATYLDPENCDLESLQQVARRDGDLKMQVFKTELLRRCETRAYCPEAGCSRPSSTATAATHCICGLAEEPSVVV